MISHENLELDVFPLFASPLIQIRVRENLDKVMSYANSQEFVVGSQTGNNGSQCSKDRRVLEKYSDIRDIIMQYFCISSHEILRYDGSFKMTTSWFTKVEQGGSQFHFHKNSFYSGILYFGEYDNKNGGSLQFNNPLEQFPDYKIVPSEYYIGNCNEYGVYPIQNLLLFFPSYLSHRIDEYTGDKPRYSLAFNIVPIGEYGSNDSTYSTKWMHKC